MANADGVSTVREPLNFAEDTKESCQQNSFWQVNKQLIPIKLTFFCQYFVVSALFMYLNLILAQHGLSASQIALAVFISNALAMFARLMSGPMTDCTNKKTRLIVQLSLFTTLMALCFLALPKEHDYMFQGHVTEDGYFVSKVQAEAEPKMNKFNFSESSFNRTCWPSQAVECSVASISVGHSNYSKVSLRLISTNETEQTALFSIEAFQKSIALDAWIEPTNNTLLRCSYVSKVGNQTDCVPLRNEVIGKATATIVVVCILLRTTLRCFHAPVLSLLESITLDILGSKKSQYFGHSRVFGSFGYFIGFLVTGAVISFINQSHEEGFARITTETFENQNIQAEYTPSIVMGAVFTCLGALPIACTKHKSPEAKLSSFKSILIALRSAEMVKCMFNCLLTGITTSLLSEYFALIMITQYGMSHFFLGVLICVIVVTEVPSFYFTGMLELRFGPANCVSVAHFIWFVYFTILVFVSNPWLLLLTQVWSGLAFPIAYNAIIQQANSVGRRRGSLVASMQAITNAILFDLTPSFGGLAWGLLLDHLQGRYVFAVAACYTFGVMVVNPLVSHGITKLVSKKEEH